MRALSLCAFALVLACSSAERDAPSQETAVSAPAPTPAEAPAPAKRPSFDQRAPLVGDPAPPLSLDTLAGERVSLPMSNADRAAVLIFGSFS